MFFYFQGLWPSLKGMIVQLSLQHSFILISLSLLPSLSLHTYCIHTYCTVYTLAHTHKTVHVGYASKCCLGVCFTTVYCAINSSIKRHVWVSLSCVFAELTNLLSCHKVVKVACKESRWAQQAFCCQFPKSYFQFPPFFSFFHGNITQQHNSWPNSN